MSNQWGRSTQVGRGGGSGFLLPAILGLLLIGAGVYGWLVRQNLQGEIASLTERNATLTDQLTEAEATRQKLADDMEALKRNSGQWAGKLEQDYSDLQLNELPKLNRLLDKRDATISDLEKQIDALKSQALRLAQGKTDAEKALNELQDAEKSKAVTNDDRQSQIDALKTELEQAVAERDEIEAVRMRTQSLLLAAQADAAASKTSLSTLQKQKLPELERELAAERAKIRDLEQRLATNKPTTPVETIPAKEPEQPGRTPRDGATVSALLDELPGLGGLDETERRRLQDELASGACVTDALETVFDKVPLIVMRNLMRELKSDC